MLLKDPHNDGSWCHKISTFYGYVPLQCAIDSEAERGQYHIFKRKEKQNKTRLQSVVNISFLGSQICFFVQVATVDWSAKDGLKI